MLIQARNKHTGFSLVEVLVALIAVATVLFGFMITARA